MRLAQLPDNFSLPHELSGSDAASVLVAFSGGADSTALLHMMGEYSRIYGVTVYAAHVNHMIRGEEADRDENFCREVCHSLGIELFVNRTDVPAFAKKTGESIETAARRVRYAFFDEIMRERGIPLLATAHNANDNLETLIFNIARGCGLSGVCGIPRTRRCAYGTVVRPILDMTRKQILEYCENNGLSYVTDSTNSDVDYTRNKIRATVIPALLEINSAAVENASRMTSSLRCDELCLESMTDWFLEELEDDGSIEAQKLLGSPAAVSNRAVLALYRAVSGGDALEGSHVEAIRRLCANAVAHSSIDLPRGIVALYENGRLYIEKKKDSPSPCDDFCRRLCEGINPLSEINAEIIIGNSQSAINIYKKSTLLYLDSAKIIGMLTVRNRRAGDKIRVHGVNKSVKKLLCDLKIPLELRYRLPVICNGEQIIAIPYAAIADGYDTKADAENALRLQFNLF